MQREREQRLDRAHKAKVVLHARDPLQNTDHRRTRTLNVINLFDTFFFFPRGNSSPFQIPNCTRFVPLKMHATASRATIVVDKVRLVRRRGIRSARFLSFFLSAFGLLLVVYLRANR